MAFWREHLYTIVSEKALRNLRFELSKCYLFEKKRTESKCPVALSRLSFIHSWYQLPLQVNSTVQGRFALVYLQSPRHALLKPHLMSALQAFDASGRVDQVDIQPSEDSCHPQSAALESVILRRQKFFVLYHCHRLLSEEQFRVLERFVVIMYSRTSPHQDVNHARQSMFYQGTRITKSIPPTQAALKQHVKRVVCSV